jgi:hypothetical protein
MIKDIHLVLEVKNSFDNSTPAMRFSTESSTFSLDFPLTAVNSFAGRREEEKSAHKKLQNKS